jgi:hypothetical protein
MPPPDVRDMSPLCAAFVQARRPPAHTHSTRKHTRKHTLICPLAGLPRVRQAYDAADGALLAPFLAEGVTFVGLVADHVGAAAVCHALFRGGEKRSCKPEKAFADAAAAPGAPGAPEERTYAMNIQSDELWPEHMYLDRVTVRDGKARALRRRACV